jgi:predicted MFS family arabinose efflux permease
MVLSESSRGSPAPSAAEAPISPESLSPIILSQRQLKSGYFVIEGLNSFATVYYFYYLYFFMQKGFGFGNKANLALAALSGAIYMAGSWWAGKFAQRFGYFVALKLGFAIMIAALAAGPHMHSARAHVLVMAATVIGMCFTWPTLEALVSQSETPAGLQRMVGIYNVVWAATGAFAYFTGGAMLDNYLQSLFYVPMTIVLVQLGLTFWLEAQARSSSVLEAADGSGLNPPPAIKAHLHGALAAEPNPRPIAKAKMFLRLAWLANPFAYIALNTVIALIPGVAKHLGLSTMLAGFFCSLWCFARLASFLALWSWAGWHYRFRWLLAAYVALMATFVLILLAPNLIVLLAAQIVFGLALGVIYSSSLFYSMDLGEAKSEHGGIHEAAIGFGNFAGPAVGAASLHFLPQYANGGALAVSVLLLLGLGGLVSIWTKGKGRQLG